MTSRWTAAFPLDELAPGAARVFRHERAQIAVFRLADGQVRACDNRCPHEGYPLAQGTVDGSVVTCWYHNYKFDLADGSCVLGEERLSVVPVRIEGDQVWLDLAPPDPAEEIGRRRASLDLAMRERRIGQLAREVVRLLALGVPAGELALEAAAWDGRHGEYGSTHALPVAADVLTLASELSLEGVAQARVLVLPFELASDASARRSPVPWPAAAAVEDVTGSLRAAVASEDADAAMAAVRGAMGRPLAEIADAFTRVASDHLFEYGHGLIYVEKALELLASGGGDVAEPVLCGLARLLAVGAREDLTPTWAPYRRALLEIDERQLTTWAAQAGPLRDREAAVQALVAASPRECVTAVLGLLEAGAAPRAVAEALTLAAAERCLRFDSAHDADPTLQDAWLDVTHLLTFAAAARSALGRSGHPDLVRFLPQVARLIARMRPLDRPAGRVGADGAADGPALTAAIQAGDMERAAALGLGLDPRTPGLRRRLCEAATRTPFVLPIFVAHAVKLTLCGLREAEALGDPRPIAAAARFLASRPVERRTEQRVDEAIALVVDGRPPRTLAG